MWITISQLFGGTSLHADISRDILYPNYSKTHTSLLSYVLDIVPGVMEGYLFPWCCPSLPQAPDSSPLLSFLEGHVISYLLFEVSRKFSDCHNLSLHKLCWKDLSTLVSGHWEGLRGWSERRRPLWTQKGHHIYLELTVEWSQEKTERKYWWRNHFFHYLEACCQFTWVVPTVLNCDEFCFGFIQVFPS